MRTKFDLFYPMNQDFQNVSAPSKWKSYRHAQIFKALYFQVGYLYTSLEKVTRFTGFAGGKVIKAIHLTFRLQSSSFFADSTWPF